MKPTRYVPEALTHLTQRFAGWVERDPDFELTPPSAPDAVHFRAVPDGLHGEALDLLNANLRERVNETGEVYLSRAEHRGRYVLRLALRHLPGACDIARAWEVLGDAFRGILVDSDDPVLRWGNPRDELVGATGEFRLTD